MGENGNGGRDQTVAGRGQKSFWAGPSGEREAGQGFSQRP